MNELTSRYEKLSAYGDPLERLNSVINWRLFMPTLNKVFNKKKKSAAGRKPYNRLMMFKVLILQQLYNLSDPQTEYQIRDRLSFIRFLGLNLNDDVPDEKTIWSYRETLIQNDALEKLFEIFENHLSRQGFGACCGSIIDASLVSAPKQRNNKEDNDTIKSGKIPEHFKDNAYRMRQKDCDARWTMKQGQRYFGYKSHINIDMKNKLIRAYEVTPASCADINCLEKLLTSGNTDNKIWADSAYYSAKMEQTISELGFESRLIKKYLKHLPESSDVAREMSRRSKLRKRVEHVFGFITNSMGGKFIRTVGLARAKFKIGMMNLTYNICRFEQLQRLGVA